MKFTYSLLIVLAAVVIAGLVYVWRPEPTVEEILDVPLPSPTPTVIDDTAAWPPQPEGVPFTPVRELVQVTFKTNKGDIMAALDGTRAPLTVGNFVFLAKENFFDGTTFHRVIPDFMIQGGDPLSEDPAKREQHGTGGPNYTFPDEINPASYGLDKLKLSEAVAPQQLEQLPPEARELTVQQFYEAQGYRYTAQVESLPMQRGVLAMANSGPSTNGSQFFIITAPEVPHLLGKHTPFGLVQQGMDVVDAISQVATDERDNPVEAVVIEDVIIHEGPLPGLKTEE
jgi:cyclophilin family peptidyl-prolyl cis-trans isomerase